MGSRFLLKLDHLAVIAPTLAKGAAHVRDCLDIDVPFGRCHHYMGTRNHRLQLGDGVGLEIIARDPHGTDPGRARWFGLDDTQRFRADRSTGRRAPPAKRCDAVSRSRPPFFTRAGRANPAAGPAPATPPDLRGDPDRGELRVS